MTIQELRQHQIVVQDPEIDRTEYDTVMGRLGHLRELISPWEDLVPEKRISYSTPNDRWKSSSFDNLRRTLTFDQFMNLEIEK